MGTLPSWFWIAVVDLGFFVAGISVLWFFARRALRDAVEDERAPRARSRSMMQVLEHRLERLLLYPPSWTDIARRLRPYFVGVLGVTAGGLILWGMWTGAASWLAEAPVPRPLPSANGSGLPWESAFDKMRNALSGPIAHVFLLIGLVAGGATLVLGESRRAIPFIAVALGAFFMIQASAFVVILGESDRPGRESAWVEQPAAPTEAASAEVSSVEEDAEGDAPGAQDGAVPQLEAASVEVADGLNDLHASDQAPVGAATTVHRSVSSDRQSHFGFGDALMMYGAYKRLTSPLVAFAQEVELGFNGGDSRLDNGYYGTWVEGGNHTVAVCGGATPFVSGISVNEIGLWDNSARCSAYAEAISEFDVPSYVVAPVRNPGNFSAKVQYVSDCGPAQRQCVQTAQNPRKLCR